jgi:hypothetical protein
MSQSTNVIHNHPIGVIWTIFCITKVFFLEGAKRNMIIILMILTTPLVFFYFLMGQLFKISNFLIYTPKYFLFFISVGLVNPTHEYVVKHVYILYNNYI